MAAASGMVAMPEPLLRLGRLNFCHRAPARRTRYRTVEALLRVTPALRGITPGARG